MLILVWVKLTSRIDNHIHREHASVSEAAGPYGRMLLGMVS